VKKNGKAKFVQDFAESFKASEATFVMGVGGLSVNQVQSLRAKLRNAGARLQIGKVRLMKIALRSAAGDELFTSSLAGQVGAVFSSNDSQQVAKNLVDFVKRSEKSSIVSGVYNSKFIGADGIKSLAAIPPYPVLVAMLAGSLNSLIAGLARSLNAVVEKGS
jgi:large subunit ribosomal protein L10